MNSLYLVPFSQLPRLPMELGVTTGLSCLPFHCVPVPWALLLDLTPLVPSELWFASWELLGPFCVLDLL